MGTSIHTRQPATPPSPSPMAHDAGDEMAVLGVAVNTRNYRALLARTGAASPSVSSAASASGGDGFSDHTVVGLPVETRNYVALVHRDNQRDHERSSPPARHRYASRSPVRHYHNGYDQTSSTSSSQPSPSAVSMGVAVEADNTGRPRRASNQRDTETINEDEDAVLGLPISTGNYLAMYRKEGPKTDSARQRSYSGLAGPPSDRASLGGRRSTPDYGIAAQNTSGSNAGRSTDSCFAMRRMSGVVVPHKGWLYIQSKTMKTWKRYFAVLAGLDFRYSPEPGRASKGFGMVQAVERWDGKPCGVRLVYTSGNHVLAYCANEAERDEWIDEVTKALERLQNSTSRSKTTYTLAADQHEGYLYKQDRTNKKWVLNFFTLRNDGYMQCRDDASSPADAKSSGYVRSVAFADVHTNALAIELASGESVFVYTETYDDRMLWYAAISALASATTKVPHSTRLVKSSYVQTALPNHSGWLYKQLGLFKSWKRVYCTLHGLEFGFAKDVNAAAEEVGRVNGVKDWDGKQHGFEVRLTSGATWRLHAESYETAKHWRSVISEVYRHADRFNIKSYLTSRRRKKLRPVFGGWLTTHKGSSHMRRFYVADGNTLGVADDVDNLLQPIGSIVDIGATRDTTNGMLVVFADGSRLKVSGDSIESAKAWYDCISSTL